MKLCTRCKVNKEARDFYKNSAASSGLHPSCISCVKNTYKKSRELFPDRCKLQSRKQHRLHPERNREKQYKRSYGISLQEFERLNLQQKALCAICNQPQRDELKKRALYVDHNHETGVVRGLLCFDCNIMLGHAKDNITTLQNAIAYLSGSLTKVGI